MFTKPLFPWSKKKAAPPSKEKAQKPAEPVKIKTEPEQKSTDRFDRALMRKGFENLSPNARKHVQKIMWMLKVHSAKPDGIWHPDTDLGALHIADLIAFKSQGEITFDLHTGAGVTCLYAGLRDGKFSAHLPEMSASPGK